MIYKNYNSSIIRKCNVSLFKLKRNTHTYKFKIAFVQIYQINIICKKCNFFKKLNLITEKCFCGKLNIN